MSAPQIYRGGVNPAPRLPRRVSFLITAALGIYIALGKIDRLIGMSPSSDGYTIGVADLSSPGLPFPVPDGTAYPWSGAAGSGCCRHPRRGPGHGIPDR